VAILLPSFAKTPVILINFVATTVAFCGYFLWLEATKFVAREVLRFCGYLLFLHTVQYDGKNWVLPGCFLGTMGR
jgi:hypothetical protein